MERYIADAAGYNQDYKIYEHDWDGGFQIGWTDNPAWILYDMLTNTRYGLGSYVDESQINIWELYKIGRFCDAVNDEGYFIGVSDGIKGLEPRFSCNVLFKDSIKIFDAINVIANLFRGAVFFANSEIHFIDDRPRSPIALFSNTHVKDGIFSYSNNRRDQQFNTIEVSYLDRFDNFNTKIEFVEDESDIRKRGVFKTTINTIGVTSRSMARRIGQDQLYKIILERGFPEITKTIKKQVLQGVETHNLTFLEIGQIIWYAFEKNMIAAGKNLSVNRYDAGHGFANPSNPGFNPTATTDAYAKAIAFLKAH